MPYKRVHPELKKGHVIDVFISISIHYSWEAKSEQANGISREATVKLPQSANKISSNNH